MHPVIDSNVERRAGWLSLLADGTDLALAFLEYVRLGRHQVGDLMTTLVIVMPHQCVPSPCRLPPT
jgi:hypothetical protein